MVDAERPLRSLIAPCSHTVMYYRILNSCDGREFASSSRLRAWAIGVAWFHLLGTREKKIEVEMSVKRWLRTEISDALWLICNRVVWLQPLGANRQNRITFLSEPVLRAPSEQ